MIRGDNMDILGIIMLFVGFMMLVVAKFTTKQKPDGDNTEEDFISWWLPPQR